MSNALKRKKKPTFFTKQDTKIIGRNDFEKRNADKVVTKSYKDFVAIGYIVLHDKYDIDTKTEVEQIPQRQLMVLYAKKGFCIEREAYRLSSASLFNYFALTLTILKKEFKLSVKKLQQFTDKFIDYIDTLANYKQFQLTVPMIAETLADEIKFVCDLEV